jgi:hypothetical protein
LEWDLQYDTTFDQFINATGTDGVPLLAFQTNDFGGDGTGAGTKSSPVTLSNTSTLDGHTFIALLEDGLSVPNQSTAPPYTEQYPYAPYIEIHYQDVLKWNGASSYYYDPAVVGNAIDTVYEDIFGP